MATVDQIQREITALRERIRSAEINIPIAEAQGNFSYARSQRSAIEISQQKIADLEAQLQQAQQTASLGTASAGEVVAQEAQAKAEGAATANPTASVTVNGITDEELQARLVETGTNGRVRPLTETQATPATPQQPDLIGESYAVPGVLSTSPGVGANRDDNTLPNNNTTAQIINVSFDKRITPQPNVLDEYASYTYAISWYLLTPDQYNEMILTQKKNCASWQLLVQSAGAPTQAAGATAANPAVAGRNQFFDKDYYIDDLEIDSLVPLKGTGAANTATDIKFKITEPNGITLIENLYKAVSTLYKQKNVSKTANYPMAQYCLAVRFYGYNDAGELVTTGRRGTNGKTNLTDPKAIVEKFYPFVITNIKFRIPKDRVVEYDITAKPIPHFYNKSQDRGTIPFAFELIGETLDKILVGKPVGTVYPNSPGERRDSPTPNTSAPTQPAQSSVVTGGANQDLGGGTINSLGVGA